MITTRFEWSFPSPQVHLRRCQGTRLHFRKAAATATLSAVNCWSQPTSAWPKGCPRGAQGGPKGPGFMGGFGSNVNASQHPVSLMFFSAGLNCQVPGTWINYPHNITDSLKVYFPPWIRSFWAGPISRRNFSICSSSSINSGLASCPRRQGTTIASTSLDCCTLLRSTIHDTTILDDIYTYI